MKKFLPILNVVLTIEFDMKDALSVLIINV